tara:strand:- start:452 stop:1033 length:582 start_codon:yes stop_codon:yes gene_type:complete
MILMIDNYDSFTYNLVDYFGKLSTLPINVYRHDAISIAEIESLAPHCIVISPGPKRPEDAGVSKDVIKSFSGKIPILGVCLGHQAIADVFGGTIVYAKQLMHGKTSAITHNNHALFDSIESPFQATRYHSLAVNRLDFPSDLEILAETVADNEIMALAHRNHPTYGVQFHPESISSPDGLTLLENFLKLCTTF